MYAGWPKEKLKEKAEEWVARVYNNSKYVTRLNNETQVITKGSFDVGADFKSAFGGFKVFVERTVDYTMDIESKDGRVKFEINQLSMEGGGFPTQIMWYLNDLEGYKSMMRDYCENNDFTGRKYLLNRLDNDKKVSKDYQNTSDHGKEIIAQIIDKLDSLNDSFYKFLKSEKSKDDW